MNAEEELAKLRAIMAQFRSRTFVMSETAFDKLMASAGIAVPTDEEGRPVRRLTVGGDTYAASAYLEGDRAYEVGIDMVATRKGEP